MKKIYMNVENLEPEMMNWVQEDENKRVFVEGEIVSKDEHHTTIRTPEDGLIAFPNECIWEGE